MRPVAVSTGPVLPLALFSFAVLPQCVLFSQSESRSDSCPDQRSQGDQCSKKKRSLTVSKENTQEATVEQKKFSIIHVSFLLH